MGKTAEFDYSRHFFSGRHALPADERHFPVDCELLLADNRAAQRHGFWSMADCPSETGVYLIVDCVPAANNQDIPPSSMLSLKLTEKPALAEPTEDAPVIESTSEPVAQICVIESTQVSAIKLTQAPAIKLRQVTAIGLTQANAIGLPQANDIELTQTIA